MVLKKILSFLAILIIIFVALALITNSQSKTKTEGDAEGNRYEVANGENPENETDFSNPYQKETLHPETIKQLEDSNYQNIILPQTLEKMLANGKDVTVYFYSPLCPYCVKTTPLITELAEELNMEIYQYNLLEFDNGWDEYELKKIPTLIHFKEGKEIKRITGYQEKADFKKWLLNH